MSEIKLLTPLSLGRLPHVMHTHGVFADVWKMPTANADMQRLYPVHAWYDAMLAPEIILGATRTYEASQIIDCTEDELREKIRGAQDTYVLFVKTYDVPAESLEAFLLRLDRVIETSEVCRCVFHTALLDYDQLFLFSREVIRSRVLGLRTPEYSEQDLKEVLTDDLRPLLAGKIPELINKVSGQYYIVLAALYHFRLNRGATVDQFYSFLRSELSALHSDRRSGLLPTLGAELSEHSSETDLILGVFTHHAYGNPGVSVLYKIGEFYARQAGWSGPRGEDHSWWGVASPAHQSFLRNALYLYKQHRRQA